MAFSANVDVRCPCTVFYGVAKSYYPTVHITRIKTMKPGNDLIIYHRVGRLYK